jgi:hypothetical protein
MANLISVHVVAQLGRIPTGHCLTLQRRVQQLADAAQAPAIRPAATAAATREFAPGRDKTETDGGVRGAPCTAQPSFIPSLVRVAHRRSAKDAHCRIRRLLVLLMPHRVTAGGNADGGAWARAVAHSERK